MDDAVAGRRRERQADWLAAGREPLVRLGDTDEEKATYLGNIEIGVLLR